MRKMTKKAVAALTVTGLLAGMLGGCGLFQSRPVPGNENPSSAVISEVPSEPGSKTGEHKVTAQDLYDFLDGKTEAKVVCDAYYLEEGVSYNYVDMKSAFQNFFNANWEGSDRELQEIHYAFTDCGNDGVMDFALEFVCGTYEEDAEGNPGVQMAEATIYILRYAEQGLEIVDSKVTGYRDWYDLNKYGVFCESGSGGANLHVDGYYAVTAEGKPVTLYVTEHTYGLTEAKIPGVKLPDGTDGYSDFGGEMEMYVYHFGEYDYEVFAYPESLYVFTSDGETVFPDPEILNYYKSNGYRVVGFEEVNKKIDEVLLKYGVTEEMLSTQESDMADWVLVDSMNADQGAEN